MAECDERTHSQATHRLRGVLAISLSISLSLPSAAVAGVVSPPADLPAFDSGFRTGQEQFNHERYLDAARTWGQEAALLPETAEHKENRRAIYEYISEAYEKSAGESGYEKIVQEGLRILDAYADGFAKAYPGDSLPENVTKVRMAFRTRLDEGQRARLRLAKPTVRPPPPPPPPPPPVIVRPPPKPWKGLTIGGAVAVGGGGAMLAMFAAGAVRAKSATAAFDDRTNMCDLSEPTGRCADIDEQGRRANSAAIAGLVLAPCCSAAASPCSWSPGDANLPPQRSLQCSVRERRRYCGMDVSDTITTLRSTPDLTLGELHKLSKGDIGRLFSEITLGQLTHDEGAAPAGRSLAPKSASHRHGRGNDAGEATAPTPVPVGKGEAAAESRKGAKRGKAKSVNTRTPEGRGSYDEALFKALEAADGPTGAATLISKVGGTSLQARAGLARLIEADRITWTGKARGTKYRLA